MKKDMILKDERTVAVENASYRWAYLVLSFGLLLDVAYRGLVRQESGWDLLALVILSGLITTFYQGSQKILTHRWVLWAAMTAIVAALVAIIIVLVR
jgi:hypothetical protein